MSEKDLDKENLSDAPDPSSLTTQLVWREIQSLKELLEARISGVEKGIEIAHEDLVRVPTAVQEAVSAIHTLLDTKISYENKLVEQQINHIEKRFQWIEISMNKSEAAFTKQIDQIVILFTTGINNLNDKVGDVKGAVNNQESRNSGAKEGVKDFRDWVPWIIAIATFLLYLYNKGK